MTTLSALLHQLTTARSAQVLTGLVGSAPAFAVARLLEHATATPLIVFVDTLETAQTLADDLCAFRQVADWRPRLLPPRALPYQALPTAPDDAAERLATLHALAAGRLPAASVIIVPIAAALDRLPPPALLRDALRTLHVGGPCDRDELVRWLEEAGYTPTPLVEDLGTMAVRGGILDCWPPTLSAPCRIEFDGDAIATLRLFDPATQRSQAHLDHVTLGLGDEVPFTDATRRHAQRELRARADAADIPYPARKDWIEAVQQGRRLPELLGLLPLFVPDTATLDAYLPREARCVWIDPLAIQEAAQQHHARVSAAAAEAPPLLRTIAPTELCTTLDALMADALGTSALAITGGGVAAPWDQWPLVEWKTQSFQHTRTATPPSAPTDPFSTTVEQLRQLATHYRTIEIVCHTSVAAERTLDLLRWHGLAASAATAEALQPIRVRVGQLSSGFCAPHDGIAFLTETELFGRKIRQHAPRRVVPTEAFVGFQDLAAGDHIVHEQHGIGRYLGLTTMDLPAAPRGHPIKGDFAQLEYLGGDKLYLPVYRLHLLQRYIGPEDSTPVLDKLGGTRWTTVKKRALQSIRTMAHELLKIYAARQVHEGTAFSGRDHQLEAFESAFPYDETPDQWQAIEDTLRDMQDPKPMDRLVCGDVGYGKTEVAIRAAFRAAADGKQVALLCPTTLLAFQHFQTFVARFTNTGLSVDLLNRFRSEAEQRDVLDRLRHGTLDIVIGTHRLLSKDIKVPRLGLLIIDEEQRFGVTHKERLRKLRATVDTLTLTATPIPRTLHMAVSGMRDISIIQTPPADRRAVRTHVVPFNDQIIREAIRYELRRGGQVFFVHNRVQTINAMRDRITALVPEARCIVAHGQMEEHELEQAMRAYIAREADVLVCTSIVEAGLDIPSANTLIVNRADTFGLSQLYQLRGRVGRSNVQAVAYLLTPAPFADDADEGAVTITPQAQRRLATLARYTELGSGFSIAMHDLEMRGAGNLLGAQQSGHITEIGYELFTRLLERTIRQLKGEEDEIAIEPEISLPVAALIPETYINDQNLRLSWYRRLAGCESADDIERLETELADRFGPLPTEVRTLLQIIALRQAAAVRRIEQLHHTPPNLWKLRFHTSTPVAPALIMRLVNREPKRYQLKPDGTFLIHHPCDTPESILPTAREIMELLSVDIPPFAKGG